MCCSLEKKINDWWRNEELPRNSAGQNGWKLVRRLVFFQHLEKTDAGLVKVNLKYVKTSKEFQHESVQVKLWENLSKFER